MMSSRSDKAGNPAGRHCAGRSLQLRDQGQGRQGGDKTIPMLYLKIIRDNGRRRSSPNPSTCATAGSVSKTTSCSSRPAPTRETTPPGAREGLRQGHFLQARLRPRPGAGNLRGREGQKRPRRAHPARRRGHGRHSRGGLCTGCEAPCRPREGVVSTTTLPTAIAATAPMQRQQLVVDNHQQHGDRGGTRGRLGSSRVVQGAAFARPLRRRTWHKGRPQGHFHFTTPATVGSDIDSAFAGRDLRQTGSWFSTGKPVSASSNAPNAAYDGLPGYMIDFDVNPLTRLPPISTSASKAGRPGTFAGHDQRL